VSDAVMMTRQATARQNIDCAVHLLLDEAAFASANLLAWAAIDILRGVAKPMQGKRRDWYRHLKEHYNYAKHADQDPDKDLEFNHDLVEMAVFLAALDYQTIYRVSSIPMVMIVQWVLLQRPELFDDGFQPSTDVAKRLFGDAPTLGKLKDIYKSYRENRTELDRFVKEVGLAVEL
jgi:hypothetical protein